MTYGQIKLRLTQAFPGMSLDLIEGWINDAYQMILGDLPWQRLTVNTTLTTVVGTPGTPALYPLPANCGLLLDDALTNAYGTMKRFSEGQLNDGDATRSQTGQPFSWASTMDDSSLPPNMMIELYPVPDAVYVLPLTYTAEVIPLGATSTILLAWMQPAALIESVTAKCKAQLKDYAGAAFHQAAAATAIATMKRREAQGAAPCQMKLDPNLTSWRMKKFYR